jgi:hypothetical protein
VRGRGALIFLLLAGCPDPECEDAWTALGDQQAGAVLAVQGTSADDVWAVGGGLGLGGALARHWNGDRWSEVPLDEPDRSLWWVWPESPGRAWMVGEGGLVAREDGAVIGEPLASTLYGVWGSAPDDVWIVGGIPDGAATADDDLVLHWDGAALTRVTVPVRGATLFKVWGAAADDVWVSGQGGTMLHWDGAVWTDRSDELATAAPALTVHGCDGDEVYAVAGQTLYALDAGVWVARDDAPITSTLNGVSCGADGVLVVGNAGLRLRLDRATGEWLDERLEGPWDTDYHGAWIDELGAAWAAGGNFNTPAPTSRRGVLAHRGCPRPARW